MDQCHFSLKFSECRDRASPSDVFTVENQTIEGKIAQKSNAASYMEREFDLEKDKYTPNFGIVTNTKN